MTPAMLEVPVSILPREAPYPMTADLFTHMIDHNLIPPDRRVILWGGRLYENMAKSKPHSAVQHTFNRALSGRVASGFFVGNENPVQLDDMHLPLADLVVVRGDPDDFYEDLYPDGRDVLLVVEVAVTSLAADLGDRLDRYSRTLPEATYLVTDVVGRRALVHTQPRAEGGYEVVVEVESGGSIALRLGGVDIEPIPFDEVMR